MYKNLKPVADFQDATEVSILVLMELCIKTQLWLEKTGRVERFNPCFNGTMYKNASPTGASVPPALVSILVLMELCIKTRRYYATDKAN